MIKSVKVRMYPNSSQRVLLEKHFGCNRLVYNWALEKRTEHYKQYGKTLSESQLMGMLTELRRAKDFLKEPDSQTLQQSIKDMQSAFVGFFRKHASFPKFKSKHNHKQSCRFPQRFKIDRDSKHVRIPKIGWVKFRDKFNVPADAQFRNITVSRENDKYYCSICYYIDKTSPSPPKPTKEKTLGIDLGIKHFATLSDGDKIPNPNHLREHEQKLKEAQRELSKKTKGTSAYKKAKQKLQRKNEKVKNCRRDFLHKLTTSIVENQDYTSVAVEDLGVKEMQQSGNRNIARCISDAGWRMFRQMLSYKCPEHSKNLLVINRFDKSSKTCNVCGWIHGNLSLNEREWTCQNCNAVHDRDENASLNIRDFGVVRFQEAGQVSGSFAV